MKRYLLLLLAALVLCAPAFGEKRFEKDLGEGVKYIQVLREDPNRIINVLIVDLDNKNVEMRSVLSQDRIRTDKVYGRETVPMLVDKYGALAGVNACFFDMTWYSDPLGAQIVDGELVSQPSPFMPIAFTDHGTAFFDRPEFKGTITNRTTGETLSFDYVDGDIGYDGQENNIGVFNYRMGGSTCTEGECTEVTLLCKKPAFSLAHPSYGRVTDVKTDTCDSPVADDNIVISASGDKAPVLKDFVSKGDSLKIDFEFVSPSGRDWTKIKQAIDGAPHKILTAGEKNYNSENIKGDGMCYVAHPRTTLGISKDSKKLIMLVIDGRQKISTGAPYDFLGDLMLEFGAWDAVNFDGGGSSTMCIEGGIVNSPSDRYTRYISNALLVMGKPYSVKCDPDAYIEGLPDTVRT
ncbi:MAG: phosphodiester glycosidase family protein, partial [Abditibacteriota bacterium]|nr:phosphodiester glycosidase family protein [Abditibacteriota bacterium]